MKSVGRPESEGGAVNIIGVLLLVLLVGALWVIVVSWGPLTSLRRDDVAEFAATYGFSVTIANGGYVVGYLVRSMRWRRWGALVGLIAGFVIAAIRTQTIVTMSSSADAGGGVMSSSSSRSTFAAGWLLLAVAGFFFGALVAELRGGVTATDPRRSAELVPRRRSDFVDEQVLRPAYFVAATAVGLFLLTLIRGNFQGFAGVDGRYLALPLAVVAVVLVIESTTRWIVSRPSPVLGLDLAIAAAAVRVSAVRRVVRIGLAMAWGLLAWEAAEVSRAIPHHLYAADGLLALYAAWSCLRTGARLRKRSWAVRRPRAARL
jgi:hypothetical protein